jgi:hypothetical protein
VEPLVEAAGLIVTERFAAWPAVGSPTVLVSADGLAGAKSRAVAAHAAVLSASTAPALTDRRTGIDDVFAAGLAMELAPGWVLVLGHASPGTHGLPSCVAAETVTPPALSRLIVLDADGRLEEPLPAVTAALPVTGAAVTRSGRLPEAGATLESAVSRALGRGDSDTARDLLGTYAAWLADDHAWQDTPGSRFSAVPGNIAVGEGDRSLTLVDGSWETEEAELSDPEVVLGVALDLLSCRLADSAVETPFGPSPSVEQMAAELAVLAGHDPAHRRDETATRLRELLTEVGLVASPAGPEPAATPSAFDELARAHELALTALEQERGRTRWLEGTLRARNRQVRLLERSIDVESSPAYKALRQAARPVPALRRAARRGLTWAQSRRR